MRQIIAMGGGGFSMEPDNPALDRYILRQARIPRPAVCFLPTASGDAERYALNFYEAFSKLDCHPSVLFLFRLPTTDLESYLLEKDVIYVGGGSTRNMLVLWREWQLDKILRKAYDAGVILSGISAGGNCWFEQCTTGYVPHEIREMSCLGFLPGSFSPHYDGEVERRPGLHRLLLERRILPGYGVDNSAALHFVDEKLFRAVHSTSTAKAYRVSLINNVISEEELDMQDIE